jgi:glycosyltransferase involved in cell wall biosynthesis
MRTVVFLEQQSWLGGAQRVLDATLRSIDPEYEPIVAFPDRGPFRSTLEDRKIETLNLPVGSYRPGKKSSAEMAAFAWRSVYCGLKLAAFIRRRQVALVYVNGPRCLPAGVLAAWLTRRPAIFHLHLVLTRKLELFLVKRLARKVSRILACSEAAANPLLDHDRRLSSKMQILYNPVLQSHDTREYRHVPMSERDLCTIGIVGRITEKKGHHLLLRAVGKLPRELRDKIRLLVVGSEAPGCESDHHYAELLRTEAAERHLEGRIVWAGYQSDPSRCYASMDLLVHPAADEALGIVVLEALDRGIPVIAARAGGIPEVIRDGFNGLLVPANDEFALGHALELFLQNRGVREQLQHGARCGIDRRFSIETFSSKIRTTINQICPLVRSPEAQHSR